MPEPTGYAKLDGPSFKAAQTQLSPRRRAHPVSYALADLEPDPAAAARARRVTRDTLFRWGLQHLSDDAGAIASELATNAINAATQPGGGLPAIIFAIHHRPPELILIVWDNGPGGPRRDAADPDAESGRDWSSSIASPAAAGDGGPLREAAGKSSGRRSPPPPAAPSPSPSPKARRTARTDCASRCRLRHRQDLDHVSYAIDRA
jgi:hypothetical protein